MVQVFWVIFSGFGEKIYIYLSRLKYVGIDKNAKNMLQKNVTKFVRKH